MGQPTQRNISVNAALTLALLLWAPHVLALDVPLTLGMSAGQELQFKPPPTGQARATSLTFSPGYQLTEALRCELGLSYIQDTYRRGKVDAEIRPSLRLQLPGYSYYGRFNLGFTHLLDAEKGEGTPSIGVALGQRVTVAGIPFHFEIGVNPRTELTRKKKLRLFWITEFRAGFSYNLKE